MDIDDWQYEAVQHRLGTASADQFDSLNIVSGARDLVYSLIMEAYDEGFRDGCDQCNDGA